MHTFYRRVRVFRLLGLVFLIGCLSACAALTESIQQPRVSIQNVQLQNMNLSGMTALFTLQVENPNGFGLNISGLNYALSLNGLPVLNGDSQQKVSVPANATNSVQLPISLKFSDLLEAVPNLLNATSVDYKLTGAVNSGLIRVPYSKSGQFQLRQ